ncbi:MAG: DUF2971 domain-containing protein [Oscillospiraceae bacterium]|jgi:hypothetical protein|nr:DUF2971 domain-containing protein [Oscillospiraceae bacterium]
MQLDWKIEYDKTIHQLLDGDDNKSEYEKKCRELVRKNFPKRLFKYSCFDNKGYWKNLITGNLYFNHPYEWNDIFDSSCNFEYDNLLAEVKKVLLKNGHSFDETKFNLFINKIIEKEQDINLNKVKYKNNYNGENIESNVELNPILYDYAKKIEFCAIYTHICRATCFTEEFNNMKMWYYYAKEYTGFCIEYDFSNYNDGSIKPVTYTDRKFIAKDFHYKFFETEIFLPMLLKNPCWKDEKEWRFISPGKFTETTMSNCPIKAIYLGNKISDQNKEKVFALLKRNTKNIPKLYIMVANKYNNSFYPEEIII